MKILFQIKKLIILILPIAILAGCEENNNDLAEVSDLEIIADNLIFAEGPAYFNGNLYFSDIQANRIYIWNKMDGLKVFLEKTSGANGLFFDNNGNLIVCEGTGKRVVSVNSSKEIKVITENFGGIPYNEPNDVWVSPEGNIYFTDPVFSGNLTQPGENVYCVLGSTGNVIRVIDDLVKPNGIVGNSSGTILYVADYGASSIYQYSILTDGKLTAKKVFAEIQADGLSIDSEGNIYAAGSEVFIINPSEQIVKTLKISGTITNLCITEDNGKTAFITTHNTVYKQTIY